jgi:hypothetical protein
MLWWQTLNLNLSGAGLGTAICSVHPDTAAEIVSSSVVPESANTHAADDSATESETESDRETLCKALQQQRSRNQREPDTVAEVVSSSVVPEPANTRVADDSATESETESDHETLHKALQQQRSRNQREHLGRVLAPDSETEDDGTRQYVSHCLAE